MKLMHLVDFRRPEAFFETLAERIKITELVTRRKSGAARESSNCEARASLSNNAPRTRVGGNELKAVCRTPATGCGALSLNHEPTMSASRNFGPEDNRVLTFKEVAARYRVCRRTLERGIATERFPRPMRIGSALRFSEVDLIAFEQKSKEPPQKAASPPQK